MKKTVDRGGEEERVREREKKRERGETGRKTDDSNSFYSLCLPSLEFRLSHSDKCSPALHLSITLMCPAFRLHPTPFFHMLKYNDDIW